MNNLLKTKVLTITIVILILLNIGTMIMVFMVSNRPDEFERRPGSGFMAPRGEGGGMRMRVGIETMLTERLHFTEEQISEFEKTREFHMKETKRISESIRSNKINLNKLVASQKVDSVEFHKSIETIAVLQGEMEKLNFNHFREIRKICNDEQREEFDRFLVNELSMHMRAPQPQGPPFGRGPGERPE